LALKNRGKQTPPFCAPRKVTARPPGLSRAWPRCLQARAARTTSSPLRLNKPPSVVTR
jgi:hypothetical protein